MKKVYAIFLTIAAACGSLYAQPTIYGYRTFQRSAVVEQNGPVKFDAKSPSKVTLIANQSKLGKVYCGTYFNYKWYVQVTAQGTQSTVEGFYTIDMNDGTRTLIAEGGTRLTEMTVDYTTGTVYGVKGDAYYLMKVDLNTGKSTQVGAFNLPDGAGMLALACNLNGEMYGISTDDNLYKIDKATGAATLVGATGVNAAYIQAMDFDRNTGELYWANTGTYSLYTVDVATGKATLVGAIGANADDSVQSLFIPYINVAKGAPDRVTDRAAEADGTTVKLSWTNPSVDAQGEKLEDFTKVILYRDGEKLAEEEGKAGEKASYEDKNVAEGKHTYDIVPINSKGEGGKDTDPVTVTVGNDRPGAVGNLKVVTGDSNATISWTAPTEGMTGGRFNPENIAGYTIKRSDSNSTLATLAADQTSYTDASVKFGRYSYTVNAFDKTGAGAETSTPEVIIKPENWIIMTTGEQIVEKGKTYKFYDGQGPQAYYKNSQNDTLTIRPNIPNGMVKAEFKVFDFDTYGDFLYIFNGASVKSPLIGKYSATQVPTDLVELESSSIDGALTFVFSSDVMSRAEGWEADVTVEEKLQKNLVAKTFSGNANPKVNEASTYSLKVFNKGIDAVAASDYKVVLKDAASGASLVTVQGVDVPSMGQVDVAIPYAPAAIGRTTVYAEIAFDADMDASDNKSQELKLNVLDENTSMVVLSKFKEGGYGIGVAPVSFMSNESVSETIYYKDEINLKRGKLESIAYPFKEVGTAYKGSPIKIYVGETDAADLTHSVPRSKLKLVFDGAVDVATTSTELALPFDTPYEYNGGNLVIMAYKKSNNGTSYDVYFKGDYGNTGDPNRCRYDSTFDDSETLDLEGDFGWSASTMFADITMIFSDTATGVKEVKIGSEDISVYPNPVENELRVSVECSSIEVFDFAGQNVASVNDASSVDMSGLAAGIYFVKATTADGKTVSKKIIKK